MLSEYVRRVFGSSALSLGLLAGCATLDEPRDAARATPTDARTRPSQQSGNQPVSIEPASGKAGSKVRIFSLVVEEADGRLSVSHATEVDVSDLGDESTWNAQGPGAATHRWSVLGGAGGVSATGTIAVRRGWEVPPRAGEEAINVPLTRVSFIVRVRFPKGARAIRISSVDSQVEPAVWTP